MDVEDKCLSNTRWAAWGVVDIEKLDTQQRRNYLRKVRAELAALGYTLHPGGSKNTPWYQVVPARKMGHTAAGPDAFRRVCAWAILQLGDEPEGDQHERGADGGVRSAGA